MKRLYQLLIGALIFLVPSNLFYVLTEAGARVHGLRVDYLLPKFYVSDVVIWALIALYFWKEKTTLQKTLQKIWHENRFETIAGSALAFVLFIRQFFATSPTIAVWTALSWIKIGILGYVLWQKRAFLRSTQTYVILAFTLLFQSVVAFWQFFTQQSVAGYWFLGETDLSSFAGLAKTTWGGVERVLPYGTTAHPNVLGGFLALGVLILLSQPHIQDRFLKTALYICMTISVVALLLTGSISAILALIVGVVLLYWKKSAAIPHAVLVLGMLLCVVITIWLPLPQSHPSVERRAYLNQAGLRMVVDHPFVGVGLQNFTNHVEDYALKKEVVRFVQPAHNVPLLFIAETGLVGILLVLLVTGKLCSKKLVHLLPLLPIALLDHYLLTLHTGILLAFVFFLSMQIKSHK